MTGERTGLDPTLKQDFIHSGLAHLLAIFRIACRVDRRVDLLFCPGWIGGYSLFSPYLSHKKVGGGGEYWDDPLLYDDSRSPDSNASSHSDGWFNDDRDHGRSSPSLDPLGLIGGGDDLWSLSLKAC